MLTASTEDIERIVREVMAQLGAAPKGVAAPEIAVREGDLFVDSRVVTLESIAGRLTGAKQLTVLPGALVTPSVRDELRRKGVALVRNPQADHGYMVPAPAAASVRKELPPVLLVVSPARHDPAAAARSLAQEGIDVRTETSECLIAATDKLAAAVAAGQSLGLLWTRHTAAGLCLANRHAGVRAVLAGGVAATAAAVAAVAANVLVVDPTAGSPYEKHQVLRGFCLGGIRQCPEALRERLGEQKLGVRS